MLKIFEKRFTEGGESKRIVVTAQYDDRCHNGHNIFAITAEIVGLDGWESCGCLHDDIAKHFPKLSHYIKWHLVDDDSPMHYVANALYWAGFSGYCDGKPNDPPNLEYLHSTIVYGAIKEDYAVDVSTLDSVQLQNWLLIRLPELQNEFREAMKTLFEISL
jgi:hypothetical protein